MRLDRALAQDVGRALHSRPIQLYLLVQLVAGAVYITRRDAITLSTVLLIWLGLSAVAFLAWWAGRHRLAHPQPDPMPAAGPRSAFALVAASGWMLSGFGVSSEAGFVLVLAGVGGWIWAYVRAGGYRGLRHRVLRDPRPFLGLYLLIGLPRLLVVGPFYVFDLVMALPSGVGQQLLLLVGLFAPLEAWSRRPGWAALVAATVFAVLHVPLVMEPNGDDVVSAVANVVIFQLSVGFIAVLAYRRHRSAAGVGVVHAVTIA